jgi:hypothetical protein
LLRVNAPALPIHTATRYVQPLREGGSLPAVVETAAAGLFVAKFRGAGQGARVLIAEIVVAGIARALSLPVPELALLELPDRFGVSEPDPEIQELLQRSRGINLGMRYLEGAFNFDPVAAAEFVDGAFAASLVWLDAYVTNPDRTARNPNLMLWKRSLWLIDHGAALYAHYDWAGVTPERIATSFPLTEKHVLLGRAGDIDAAADAAARTLTDAVLASIVAQIPDVLLLDPVSGDDLGDADASRDRYLQYLIARRDASGAFTATAVAAQATLRAAPPLPYGARR